MDMLGRDCEASCTSLSKLDRIIACRDLVQHARYFHGLTFESTIDGHLPHRSYFLIVVTR